MRLENLALYGIFLQESGTRAIGLSGLEAPGPSDPRTPTRSKRVRYEDLSSSTETPKSRRRKLDTPTRHAIGRLQPTASPLVAVRMQLTNYLYYLYEVTPFGGNLFICRLW